MPRIASLDGLRAISIALVLMGHICGTHGFWLPYNQIADTYANFGVRVFFVISGFLISSILLSEHKKSGTISLKRFYIRRAYRIWPAAYAFLIVIVALKWQVFSVGQIAIAASYLSCFALGMPWVVGHLWSLSVEETFYMIWPAVMLLAFRRKEFFCWAAVLTVPVVRVINYKFFAGEFAFNFFAVMDALAIGCLAAIYQERMKSFCRSKWILAIGGLATLIPLAYTNAKFYIPIGISMVHIGVALITLHVVQFSYKALNNKAAVYVGQLSYALYLCQQPFLDHHSQSLFCRFPLNLLLAFSAALTLHYLVEKPMLSMREQRQVHKSSTPLTSSLQFVNRAKRGVV